MTCKFSFYSLFVPCYFESSVSFLFSLVITISVLTIALNVHSAQTYIHIPKYFSCVPLLQTQMKFCLHSLIFSVPSCYWIFLCQRNMPVVFFQENVVLHILVYTIIICLDLNMCVCMYICMCSHHWFLWSWFPLCWDSCSGSIVFCYVLSQVLSSENIYGKFTFSVFACWKCFLFSMTAE